MTISTTSSQIQYTGDGASLAFAFPTPFISTSDIKVYLNGVLQASGYSVAGLASIGGSGTFPSGTVTFVAAPGVGVIVLLVCDPDLLQSTSLPPNDPFPSKTVEKMIDKVTLLIQRLYGKFGNAITFPVGETTNGVLPAAAARANLICSFDSAGNVQATAPVAGSATALALLLASTTAAQGSALVGSNDAANYFNGATVEAILQEIANPKGQFQLDGVNVLRYITPAQWPAILNYTSTADLAAQLQAAHTAERNLVYPDGRFNTSTKITLRTDAKVRGINRRGTQLRATANVSIFELPYLNVDVDIERIYFCSNANATGTGISVAATAGTFQGYSVGLRLHDCDFGTELAFGLDIDPIVCVIEKNSFGVDSTTGYAPAAGASTFVAMRARQYPATTNATNVNRFSRNKVFRAGSNTVAGIQLASGANWVVEGNDIEQGGVVLSTTDISRLDFIQNWMEGNVVTNDLIVISGSGTTYSNIENNHIAGNTVGAGRGIINYASTVPTRLDVHGNDFGKNAGSYVLYDNATTVTTLPASGIVAFWDNVVSGDTVGDKCVTGTEFRGGKTSPRLSLCGDTTAAPTIFDSNDPGAAIVRNSAGSVTITGSHPFATTTNKIRAHCTGHTNEECRVLRTAVNQVTVNLYNGANVATDGPFTLTVWGS